MDEVPGVMKVTGPLLVFGGPYSNLEATKAVLGESRRRQSRPATSCVPAIWRPIAPTRKA
jgi:hypothetical protein